MKIALVVADSLVQGTRTVTNKATATADKLRTLPVLSFQTARALAAWLSQVEAARSEKHEKIQADSPSRPRRRTLSQ